MDKREQIAPIAEGNYHRFPQPGDVMRFLGKNGYDSELSDARKRFEVGQLLTVKACDVGDWSHSIQFEECSGRYNGVMFERVEHDPSPAPGNQPPEEQAAPKNTTGITESELARLEATMRPDEPTGIAYDFLTRLISAARTGMSAKAQIIAANSAAKEAEFARTGMRAEGVAVEAEWHRDGNLLYTLRQTGWWKGKPTFSNHLMVRVEGARMDDKADADALASRILAALQSPGGE